MPSTATHAGLRAAALELDAGCCITIVRQSVAGTTRGYRYRLLLAVRRSDADSLAELLGDLRVAGRVEAIVTAGAPHAQIVWTGATAADVLERILPHLRARRREAALALQFWVDGGHRDYPRGPVPAEYWPIRDRLYERMRQLKAALARRAHVRSARRGASDA